VINKSLFSSACTEWETPQKLFDKLNDEFNFDLDAAASEANTKCKHFFTIVDNALLQNWYRPDEGIRTVWINCPYGRGITGKWVKKAYEESKKGATVVALLPARTDTKFFHEWIYKPSCEDGHLPSECKRVFIRFIKGRLVFEIDGEPIRDKKGRPSSAPFPSMIIVWRPLS
jgi:phage N-6-adenine-methyltransferase